MSPEEKARLDIDKKLIESGWVLQDMNEFNPRAALGVAVREFPTKNGDEVDYALFIDDEPCGIIEAKADLNAVNLPHVMDTQVQRYLNDGLKGSGDCYDPKYLRFAYAASSSVIDFEDVYDPAPLTRKIYQFFRPEYLKKLITEYKRGDKKGTTLRSRMKTFPELPKHNFRDCQISAINGLENSFSQGKQRALLQMATGAGKTYTAITAIYRLLKETKAKRVLFLVDTYNLGTQAMNEFNDYRPYDSDQKFNQIYETVRIETSNIPQTTRVCISTIQRIYSMLCGDIKSFKQGSDDVSLVNDKEKREPKYNKEYPPEFFDIIFVDECHRSIYNNWKGVLDYFDAFQVGLTATPDERTYGYFDGNIVSEYSHEQACADGVNVPCKGTYIIETEKSVNGGIVKPLNGKVLLRDRQTRVERWHNQDDDEQYGSNELQRKVVNHDQIRTVIKTLKANWSTWEIFAGRKEIPKTLIFAIDDSHADDIVRIVRQEFGKGNDFCKKITYMPDTDSDPQSKMAKDENALLTAFRNDYNPRIAVTVTKIATGTDVKCLEILLFMRDVKSGNLYEQMHGRARRTFTAEMLKRVSPSAQCDKLGYIVVDAVGVSKSKKNQRQSAKSTGKETITFKDLIQSVVTSSTDEHTFQELVSRLTNLNKVISDAEKEKIQSISGGKSLTEIISRLSNAHDPDAIEADIKTMAEEEGADYDNLSDEDKESFRKDVIRKRCREASAPLCDASVREYILNVRKVTDQTIDPALDLLRTAKFSDDISADNLRIRQTFAEFINNEDNRNRIDALSILYHCDYRNRKITAQMISDLYTALLSYNATLTRQNIFYAYEEFCRPDEKTKKPSVLKQLTDIIQVIRYEWADKKPKYIIPFASQVAGNYKKWIFKRNENKAGKRGDTNKPFTEEQMRWIEAIRNFIADNGSIEFQDLDRPVFRSLGDSYDFEDMFEDCDTILLEMNETLVA